MKEILLKVFVCSVLTLFACVFIVHDVNDEVLV